MIVFELTGGELHPVYQQLQIENGERQYSFAKSMVAAALGIGRPVLSQTILKALNFHAVACLHGSAGQFRPCDVTVGQIVPAAPYRVQALMDDFINQVNWSWQNADPFVLAAYVLWGINFIHPFENGNGRTARAAAYFVICVKLGGWLPGEPILPEMLKGPRRDDYVNALRHADQNRTADGLPDLMPMVQLLTELIIAQITNAEP